jgi:hypothetical protein
MAIGARVDPLCNFNFIVEIAGLHTTNKSLDELGRAHRCAV